MGQRLPVAEQCVCVVGGAIDIIGKKWTLCIVVTLGNRPGIRFNELLDGLGGISPRTLSETLKALEAEGLVDRKAYRETPPRVEYRLTPAGDRLRAAVAPLMEWAAGRPGAVCRPSRRPSNRGPSQESQ
ncbi:MAG TPA: helix-turn-helix domain-containing protein [Candidatus Thermoplasmatota archaeon]|nr:helix-turn-helix domain-containing protein [Candidatus Thermoplasmatota archaeon]